MAKNKLNNNRLKGVTGDIPEKIEDLEKEEILLTISEGIIDYRKRKGITQRELAEMLDINQAMISKLESGNYNATFKLLHRITTTLTKSSDMFIEILEEIIKNVKKIRIENDAQKSKI